VGPGIVLVDTGPLVALFDPSDRARAACRAALDRLARAELVTTLAVLTEAMFLLGFSPEPRQALCAFLASGAVRVEAVGTDEIARAGELMTKYAGVPMDFADATLVLLAERFETVSIFSLDEDFDVYRVGRKAFRRLPV
jgi:hypothetical protein